MTVERAMNESLVYERAYTNLGVFIRDLRARKNEDARFDLANGEEPDAAYDIILADFEKIKEDYGNESKRLWKMAEKKSEFYDWAFEDLANAVVIKAVEDYEMAVCGMRNDSEILLIEKFAESADEGEMIYTKLNVKVLLDRVKKAHEEFVKITKEHGTDILLETRRKRKAKDFDYTKNKYKCPMCGGGLFTQTMFGVHRVVCTGCYLSEVVKVDKKRVI